MKVRVLAVLAAVLCLFSVPLFAGQKEKSDAYFEGRFGATWGMPATGSDVLSEDNGYFLIGFRFGGYPWKLGVMRKTSINFSFDFMPIEGGGGGGYSGGYGGGYGGYGGGYYSSYTTMEHNGVFLFPHVGYDIVKKENFVVFVHGGFAVIGEWLSYKMQMGYYGGTYNLCDEQGLAGECYSRWTAAGGLGVGFRYYPDSDGGLYVGAQYTRMTDKRNHGTVSLGYSF